MKGQPTCRPFVCSDMMNTGVAGLSAGRSVVSIDRYPPFLDRPTADKARSGEGPGSLVAIESLTSNRCAD